MMPDRALRGLYAISPDAEDAPQVLAAKIGRAIAGGARIIQYRDKSADEKRQIARARAIADVCRQTHSRLIINDDIALAAAVAAAGVHLGEHDAAIAEARAALGPEAVIGASCYDQLGLARRAAAAGASYLAFGAFHPSPTKPQAAKASPRLLAAAKVFNLPLVAIGGITPENGGALLGAGADMLAVVSGIFGAADIEVAARSYSKLFEEDFQA